MGGFDLKIIVLMGLVLFLAYVSNQFTSHSHAIIGSNYGQSEISQCLNDPAIIMNDGIIIGTSVTRESTPEIKSLTLNNHSFYNCGVSAIVKNLDFAYLLMNLLGHKYNLTGKEILVELNLQAMLASDSILSSPNLSSVVDMAPLQTKLFWIEGAYKLSKLRKLKISLETFIGLSFKILFPSSNLIYLDMRNPFKKRENLYLGKNSKILNSDKTQIDFFSQEFNQEIFIYRIKEIEALASQYGASVRFIFFPTNSLYTSKVKDNLNKSIDLLLNDKNIFKKEPINLMDLNNPEYFADCCHFNQLGQQAFELELKKIR